jgi:hypothetical protein
MSNYMLDKLLVRGDHTKKSFAFAHCCFDHPRLGGQQRQKKPSELSKIKPHTNFPILTWSLKNEVPDNFLKGYGTFVIYISTWFPYVSILNMLLGPLLESPRKLQLGDSRTCRRNLCSSSTQKRPYAQLGSVELHDSCCGLCVSWRLSQGADAWEWMKLRMT